MNKRREVLKTLISLPLLGTMGYGLYQKEKNKVKQRKTSQLFEVGDVRVRFIPSQDQPKEIRLGIIGNGTRGQMLLQACGFITPERLQELKAAALENKQDNRYEQFMQQDDLRVRLMGVCDIFDLHAREGMRAGANSKKEANASFLEQPPKRYRHYRELLADPEIDAVIIATPDHWHGTMTIAAAAAGKHVYLEKPLSWTVEETYLIRDAVHHAGIKFQLGHQGRQIESYARAKEMIAKGLLGPISLIEVCTNRNDANGAWVYDIPPEASEHTIDWQQFKPDVCRETEYLTYMRANQLDRFVGPADYASFSLERFFRWRCWWDYSTGLSGDLLTHEYDAINQVMGCGIPASATSSGGVYFFKDGRTVPDVLQTTFEFPDQGFSLLYSATQANARNRGKVFMGHDASMELNKDLLLTVDKKSTRYKEVLDAGLIQADVPILAYRAGAGQVDAISSATELYFAQRGLLYTYIDGKQYDTTFLHIREWLECIRQNLEPSGHIDMAFEEAMTAHMGTRAYLEGRTMYWDREREAIVRG